MGVFRTLTAAYAAACIASGMVRELLPKAGSRKVINTISGLYILLVLVYSVQECSDMHISWDMSVPEASDSGIEYQQNVINETKARLEKTCGELLLQHRLNAEAEFTLAEHDGIVSVARADICSERPLSTEQRQEVLDILKAYAPAEVNFDNRAETE